MNYINSRELVCLGLLIITACARHHVAPPDPHTTQERDPAVDQPPAVAVEPPAALDDCDQRVTSSLPGASLRVTTERCAYSLDELIDGVDSDYEVRVESVLHLVKPYTWGAEVPVPWPRWSGSHRLGCIPPDDASNLSVVHWIWTASLVSEGVLTMTRTWQSLVMVAFGLVGCGAATAPEAIPDGAHDAPRRDAAHDAPRDAAHDAPRDAAHDAPHDASPECGATMQSSTLAGVTLHFPPQDCVFTLAEARAGVTIDYEVIVAAEHTGTVRIGPPFFGDPCQLPSPSGLEMREVIEGNGQKYCLCDLGECDYVARDVTLHAGVYPHVFKWDGVNWDGPSDTSEPKGPPFPVGMYILEVSTTATHLQPDGSYNRFDMTAQFAVTLVE